MSSWAPTLPTRHPMYPLMHYHTHSMQPMHQFLFPPHLQLLLLVRQRYIHSLADFHIAILPYLNEHPNSEKVCKNPILHSSQLMPILPLTTEIKKMSHGNPMYLHLFPHFTFD